MHVLGLNTMENASACLVSDGRMAAAAEEERFTRVKHQEGIPLHAIRYCLEEGGVELADIDIVALSWQPWRIFHRVRHVLELGLTSPRHFIVKVRRGTQQVAGNEWWRMIALPRTLPRLLGVDSRKCRYRFHYIDHHLCHAASAFYPSPFSKAAILTLDGAGESACMTFNRSDGKEIERLGSIRLPHSLGHLYSAATAFLGFRVCSGEGKVMGLAPYGKDNYSRCFERMVALHKGGGVTINFKPLDYHLARSGIFTPLTYKTFGTPRKKEGPLEKRHKDIAASLQTVLETAALHLADHLYCQTGLESLCLAGGVALNARMNQRIEEASPFQRVFIQPAANDAGTSLGAALAAAPPTRSEDRYPMHHAYLGPQFSDKIIEQIIINKGLKAFHCPDVQETAAQLLARGKIVGWFQGRMEFGPRALGNRSILADPRRAEMKDIMNQRVKHRESFRPFAPAVLADRAAEYFKIPGESPFMTKIAPVAPHARELIPAVVHVDGTARLQTVSRETNPMFYGLIQKYDRLTNIPVILNTSFNIRGEPIVCTPLDAIECYLGTGMDALAIGSFLLTKKDDDPSISV